MSVTGDSIIPPGCSAARISQSRMLHRAKPHPSCLQQKREGGHWGRAGKRRSWDSGLLKKELEHRALSPRKS